MKWSFKLFTLFGIPVKIHITFFLLLLFTAVVPGGVMGGFTGLSGVGIVALIFTCVLIHEFSHSLVARRYSIPVQDITLLPIGGVARIDEVPDNPRQEIVISLAGPLASFALAIVFYLIGKYADGYPAHPTSLWSVLFQINTMLGLFNVLPAFPMDGGRALRAFLAMKMNWLKATRIAVTIGQLFAMLLFFAGIYLSWWLSLIAVFIYLGAEGEERMAETRMALASVPVSQSMLTSWQSVAPSDTIDAVMAKISHSLQWDFPVMEEGRLVGILPKDEIFKALPDKPRDTRVSEIMLRDFYWTTEDMPLDELAKRMSDSGVSLVPILRDGELKGLLSLEQLGRFQMMRVVEQERPVRLGFQRVWEYSSDEKEKQGR